MSRTYRKSYRGKRTTKGKLNAIYKARLRSRAGKYWTWQEFQSYRNSNDRDWILYSNAPSQWNRYYHTKPRRAKERNLLDAIKSGYLDYDNTVFPDGKKPVVYYY